MASPAFTAHLATSKAGLIFGREPVLWISLIAVTVKLCVAFAGASTGVQAGVNGVVAAAAGLATAVITKDGVSAAALGFIQAGMACAVGFGLKWSPDQQAIVMSFVATLAAMFVRTQVEAPTSAAALHAGLARQPATATPPATPPTAS
jgi:hypothetical protein